MTKLAITKLYAANTRPSKGQLDAFIDSTEIFFNQTKFDEHTIQADAITTAKLATNAIIGATFASGSVTSAKLAAAVLALAIPTGAILEWPAASGSIPTGWLLCNGQKVSRSTYSALFAIIVEAWGQGDNSTTFNVPDLQGLTPIGDPITFAAGYDEGYHQITVGGENYGTGGNVGALNYGVIQHHTHDYVIDNGAGSSTVPDASKGTSDNDTAILGLQTDATYGTIKESSFETRPLNKTTNYMIKT